MSASLPDFPWDTLADAKARAAAHPDGMVDLSVGTPVDPVAPLIREALAAAGSAPGYPATAGTARLRAAAVSALARRYGITGLAESAVLPVIGSKELIAWLPTLLGLGPRDVVVVPELAYPTYDVGARLARAQVLRADSLTQLGPQTPALLYLNSRATPPDGFSDSIICARSSGGPATEACWWLPTSATWVWRGMSTIRDRCRCCIPRCATATIAVCLRCIRCRRRRHWPATGPVWSPAMRHWSPNCWPCASTPE
ncbi:aminotransferase class I and II family protein [Mycobacterium kansasii]|uniref:Aminotransferase class I and II family protein n=1 Tax=Mycobacterium kansasii TaxID=1768 RepID=A0A1V3XHM2_MYCKA|nr:aminotransferase class I and II family protein [Mycobacterium kansasii]